MDDKQQYMIYLANVFALYYSVHSSPNPKPPSSIVEDLQEVVPDGDGSYLYRHMQASNPSADQLNIETVSVSITKHIEK